MLKDVDCTIKGISPLLMHRFPMEKLETPIENLTMEEQAEIAAYRNKESNELFVPGIAVWACLVSGAVYSKGKGRATLQKPTAACLMVTPEYCYLGTQQYEIDARPVVVPSTKGRIVRFRPRFNEWSIDFNLEYDPALLMEVQVREIVDNSGKRVGLLDFRPACKGPFGRFVVTSWQVNGGAKEAA